MIGSNPFLLGDDGYQTPRSLRLRAAASGYMSRTLGTPTDIKKYAISFKVKRAKLGVDQVLISAPGSDYSALRFDTNDRLVFYTNNGASTTLITTAKYRDTSAHYHIVLAYDTTQATAADRVKMFVNGVQVTAFDASTYPSLNSTASEINSAVAHNIGRYQAGSGYFDGYLSEFTLVDGTAPVATSFGETDPITGVWLAKKYTSSYGVNGFYLDFSDPTSTTTIAYDRSGNANHWTTSGISVTAGSTYDSMLDVPLGSGGQERGNYCVLNPLAKALDQPTFSEANLKATATVAWNAIIGSIGMLTGKWYWEMVPGSANCFVGIIGENANFAQANPQNVSGSIVYYDNNGAKRVDGVETAYGSAFTTQTIGVALDMDGGTVTFYRDNVSQGAINLSLSVLNGKTVFPFVAKYDSTLIANFGQRPFTYTPPTGFKALHTGNLSDPTIKKPNLHFDVNLWTGNNTSGRAITGLRFAPGLAWIKNRGVAYSHNLFNIISGSTKPLISNNSDGETTTPIHGYLGSFTSDGYTLTNGSSTNGYVNDLASLYVGLNWKSGGAPVANTSGGITSQVSVNAAAGFSIVTWTGTGSNSTVGHGLGVAPKLVIVKRTDANGNNWVTWHTSIASANTLFLDAVNAETSNANVFNSTVPTSSVFSVGTNAASNGSAMTYVAYCFAEIPGYSKMGLYPGNGLADGPFVNLGFKPRFLLIKTINASERWLMWDGVRDDYNQVSKDLVPNTSAAEAGAGAFADLVSNGFKIRSAASSAYNYSGYNVAYLAIAESPFKYANAR